jgi:hypothetical protein
MRLAFLVVAAGAACACPAVAGDAPTLANDPFVRPQLVEHQEPATAAEAAAPPLELRAILFAGDASRVDIGGRIVRVGEEIDGFTLISVSEDGALFERGGRSIRIALPEHGAASSDAAPEEESDDAS